MAEERTTGAEARAEKQQKRQADWAKLLKWLGVGAHRTILLESVARLNRRGDFPSQKEAMDRASRVYRTASRRSNGSQAIRDLIAEGFLVDQATGGTAMRLAVAWDFVGVLSDWQEERGLARLDQRLRSV